MNVAFIVSCSGRSASVLFVLYCPTAVMIASVPSRLVLSTMMSMMASIEAMRLGSTCFVSLIWFLMMFCCCRLKIGGCWL